MTHARRPNVRSARVAACCGTLLLLSGCVPELIPTPAALETYDFGPLPERTSATELPQRYWVDAVTAPSWLETPSIFYRRLDVNPAALRPYAQNQWIATTTELFAERLSYRLAQAAPDMAEQELPLQLEILTFEHVYTGPDEAYVLARALASYEDLNGRVHTREFVRRRPAAANVDGATRQLPAAAEELLASVLDWLQEGAVD